MEDLGGDEAAWGAPPSLGDVAAAPWSGAADLDDFSWFASASSDLMPPMLPVGGPPLPRPPAPLAADPLGQQFDLLLPLPQDAAQQQWAQQFVQPQFQQQQLDLPQPAQQPGGGSARTGRRAASKADAEEARRARNRAAQARFREKQKARDAALIAEHAAKGAELEQTRQEREDLEAHSQVLQKVLDAKDACIAVLGATAQDSTQQAQQAQQPAAAPHQLELQMELAEQQPAEPWMLEAPAAAPAPLPRQQSGSDLVGPPLSDAVKEQLQRMSEFPVSIIVQTDLPPTAHPDEAMAVAIAHQEGSSSEPRKHSLQALVKERPELVQQALQAPPDDLVTGWRRCAAAWKEILARYDATGSAAELDQIHRIFREFSGRMAVTLHFKPENAQALFATGAHAPPGHWQRIAACLQPTEAQRATLRHMWRSFAGELQAIRAERAQAMQAAVAASVVTPDVLPASTLGGLMSGYLELCEAAGRLSTLHDEEFIVMLRMLAQMGAVFSPLQKARAAAASSPYFPDSVELVRLLSEGGPAPAQQQAEQQAAQQQQQQQQQHEETAG